MQEVVETKKDIFSIINKNKQNIRRFGVKRLGLFGSFVRGEQKSTSDIDFIVEFEPGKKTFDNFIQLSFFLEEILKQRVELVTRESLSPYIGPKILKEIEYVNISSCLVN